MKALKIRPYEDKWMIKALGEAGKALKNGDVPIGCVIVFDGTDPNTKAYKNALERGINPGQVIGKGYNRRNKDHSSLGHAEISAIKKATGKIGDWRLEDCTMYVTLEPCPMCAGAILQSRIPRVVIGAMNKKAGCCGSVINLLEMQGFNHRCHVERGVRGDESQDIIKKFFTSIR